MKKIVIALLILLFIVPLIMEAQEAKGQITIAGRVTDATTGEALPGVNIIELGTSNGTISDANGEYSLKVTNQSSVLAFSFIGYLTEEITVGLQNNIDITLALDITSLEEIVVTGYQVVKKADLTGAVAVANMDEVTQESNVSVITSLQGRLPGVQISGDGNPGSGNTSINIRGFSTINNNNPLIIIDGIPIQEGSNYTNEAGIPISNRLNTLNPNDIESIQVLKDAASASVYGSRAANGVIVITTKKGKKADKIDFNFQAYQGYEYYQNHIEMLNSKEWGDVYVQHRLNSGRTPRHDLYEFEENEDGTYTTIVPAYIDEDSLIPGANTVWWDEVTTQLARQQFYSFSASKGSDAGSFYFSGSYLDQDGIFDYTFYKRLSARLNSDFKMLDGHFVIGENLNASYSQTYYRNEAHNTLLQSPLVPVYDLTGNYGGPTEGIGDKPNSVRLFKEFDDNPRHEFGLTGNAYAMINFLRGFTLKSATGVNYIQGYINYFYPKWKEGTREFTKNYLETSYDRQLSLNWTNTLSYVKTFDIHSVNAVVGYEAIKYDFNALQGRREEFPVEVIDYRYLNGGLENQTNIGQGTAFALSSYFAKADYVLLDRYLLSGTIRHDASSRLGATNNSGIFPAFSAGWRISKESFMNDFTWLSNLKLRYGYGKTGNQEIGDFSTYSYYTAGEPDYSFYDLTGANTGTLPGYKVDVLGNESLKWETTTQNNFGLDFGAFNNRLTLSLEYYIKKTNDMLINPDLIGTLGEGKAPWVNGGKLENKGWEGIVYFKDTYKGLNYNVNFNFTANKNEITDLGELPYIPGGYKASRIMVGQPYAIFYGYVADGLFSSLEDIRNHADQGLFDLEDIDNDEEVAKALGRIKYRDLNSDGVIDVEDRQVIGNPHPKFTWGSNISLEYKNFDFSMYIMGVHGVDLYNTLKEMTDFTTWNFNYGKVVLDAWTPENPNSKIPAVQTNDNNLEKRESTYFIEDGSYIKIKSLVLGYSLPRTWLEKIKLEQLRIYIQAQNLLTFTDYSGLDPEVGPSNQILYGLGIDTQLTPHATILTAGLNISF